MTDNQVSLLNKLSERGDEARALAKHIELNWSKGKMAFISVNNAILLRGLMKMFVQGNKEVLKNVN